MHVEKVFRPPVTSGQSDGLFCKKNIFSVKLETKQMILIFLYYRCYFLNELGSKFVRP
jgi:hypothetical protein